MIKFIKADPEKIRIKNQKPAGQKPKSPKRPGQAKPRKRQVSTKSRENSIIDHWFSEDGRFELQKLPKNFNLFDYSYPMPKLIGIPLTLEEAIQMAGKTLKENELTALAQWEADKKRRLLEDPYNLLPPLSPPPKFE